MVRILLRCVVAIANDQGRPLSVLEPRHSVPDGLDCEVVRGYLTRVGGDGQHYGGLVNLLIAKAVYVGVAPIAVKVKKKTSARRKDWVAEYQSLWTLAGSYARRSSLARALVLLAGVYLVR